jgi:Putative addiction module component
MNDKVKILIDEVRKLSDAERDSLIAALDQEFGASAADLDQAWSTELDRRKQAVAQGQMPTYDADTMIDDLRVRLARRQART